MDEIAIKYVKNIIYNEGKMYMISHLMTGVMVYDFNTKKVEKLCDYPQGAKDINAFEIMLVYGTKLYLFPCGIDSIYCYDLERQQYTELVSLHSITKSIPERLFFEAVVHDELIYAVCRSPHLIICINPMDDNVQVWEVDQEIPISDKIVHVDFSVCVYGNTLLYPYSSDMMIEFNTDDKKYKIVHLIREEEGYDEKYRCLLKMTMNDTGKQWVYDWYGSVYEIVSNKMVKINMPPELEGLYDDGMYTGNTQITGVLFNKDRLYFLLNSDKRILVYDTQTNGFTWIDNILTSWKPLERKDAYITYTHMQGNTYLLYDLNDGNIHVLDLETGFGDTIEMCMLTEDITKDNDLWEYWKSSIFRQEDLRSYMKYIWKISDTEIKSENSYCGEKIYCALMKEFKE